jgi:hypothetical protein
MSAAPLTADAFEAGLARYLEERSEEARRVRVGEKETSEQAAIVARHAHLFSREQLAALREEERAVNGTGERLARLRLVCEGGIVAGALVGKTDDLENALLATRLEWKGERLPLRTAQARLAVIADYDEREALGALYQQESARFNDERRALLAHGESLAADLSGIPAPVERAEAEKGMSLRTLERAVATVADAAAVTYERLRDRWLDRLLGPAREEVPASLHAGWLRRLSPLAGTYERERCVPVCAATLSALGFDIERENGIKLDLDDRPQKSPRACVIASDPPRVVHLITRAQGGMHDYAAFLHEAGHALHYASCEPTLPLAFRRLARDHALTEIYSYILEAIVREPGWHAEHFGLAESVAEEHAEASRFLEAFLFRRYVAKLSFELAFWDRFSRDGGSADGYEERLTQATGLRYQSSAFLADMDAGFYSADYLRAWIRAAQLRVHLRETVGEDWWRSPATGELLRELTLDTSKLYQGTGRPTGPTR